MPAGRADGRLLLAEHATKTRRNTMRKLLSIATALAALALAGAANAAPGDGSTVVRDQGCFPSPLATTCITTRTVTHVTRTPSGLVSYVQNGTIERTMTFFFGATYTVSSEIHNHNLFDDGEFHESSDHYDEVTHYTSGTYSLTCTSVSDIHWVEDAVQISSYELDCATP
jgi:hypothetical protein